MTPTAKTTEPHPTLGEQSKKVYEDVKELGEVALESASHAVDDLRERGSEALHSGKERAVEAKQSLDSYITEKPLQSVAIALGAGFLLGIFSRR